jgi:hypothetical protein
MQHVKKSAVLCSQCSLIAHSRCAGHAPPTCDLRSQLLLYAQFAERGGSPAMDFLRGPASSHATSDAGGPSSSRNSLDLPQGTPPTPGAVGVHPPTAYKLHHPFRRSSRSSLTPDPVRSPSSASLSTNMSVPTNASTPKLDAASAATAGVQGLRRKLSTILAPSASRKERPQSLSSTSTSTGAGTQTERDRQSASMRSRGTDSSHRANGGGRAEVSISEEPDSSVRPSVLSNASAYETVEMPDEPEIAAEGVPGGFAKLGTRKHRRTAGSKSEGNCLVQ